MQIGRILFFEKTSGNHLADSGEREGIYEEQINIDDFIKTHPVLSNYKKENLLILRLEYGEYSSDFASCNGFKLNTTTNTLEFSYPEPNNSETPNVYQKPLSIEVEELKIDLAATDTRLLELMESILM